MEIREEMKKPLTILLLLLITSVHSQDIMITISGQTASGKFIGISYPYISFQMSGARSPQNVPILSVARVELDNGSIAFDLGRAGVFLTEDQAAEVYKSSDKARALMEETRKRSEMMSKVFGNTESNRYHSGIAEHLPPDDQRKEFSSVEAAEKEGFQKCKACFYTAPEIDNYQLEKMLARSVNASVRTQYEILYEYKKINELDNSVKKILDGWTSDLIGYDYRVLVLRDDDPNAFAVAGGNIYLTTGLLELVETPNELDFVLAHEIAHIEGRHSIEHYKDLQKTKLITSALSLLVVTGAGSAGRDVGRAARIMNSSMEYANVLMSAGFSRELEEDADIKAIIYQTNAGISNDGAINILDKLLVRGKRLRQTANMNVFSSHPELRSRIRHIKEGEMKDIDPAVVYKSDDLSESPSLSLSFNRVYKAPSSTDAQKELMIFYGTFINSIFTRSFQIKEFSLKANAASQQINIEKIAGILSPAKSEKSFTFQFEVESKNSGVILDAIQKGKMMINADLSEVLVLPDGTTKRPQKRFQQVVSFKFK